MTKKEVTETKKEELVEEQVEETTDSKETEEQTEQETEAPKKKKSKMQQADEEPALDDEDQQETSDNLLVPLSTYLSTGIHIGMSQRVKAMMPYIYKVRSDKLSVFDIQKIDDRLRIAATFLAQYNPEDIIVVSRKKNGFNPARTFARALGTKSNVGRFMPGTLTNPNYPKYIEPKVIVVTDPYADKQAIEEAFNANIPIVAMCDTYNDVKNVDIILPLNNKGKKSVALAYWIIAKEILKSKGEIKGDAEFKYTIEDFENNKKK